MKHVLPKSVVFILPFLKKSYWISHQSSILRRVLILWPRVIACSSISVILVLNSFLILGNFGEKKNSLSVQRPLDSLASQQSSYWITANTLFVEAKCVMRISTSHVSEAACVASVKCVSSVRLFHQGYGHSSVKVHKCVRVCVCVCVWKQGRQCVSLTSRFHHSDINKTHAPTQSPLHISHTHTQYTCWRMGRGQGKSVCMCGSSENRFGQG